MIKIIILLFIFHLITYPQSASIRINVTATVIDPVRIEVKNGKVEVKDSKGIRSDRKIETKIIKDSIGRDVKYVRITFR